MEQVSGVEWERKVVKRGVERDGREKRSWGRAEGWEREGVGGMGLGKGGV